MSNMYEAYPATLDIDYPDHKLNRFTTFLRPIVAIPILIVLALVSGPTLHVDSAERGIALESGGIVAGATALVLLFRRKYPRWWFDWNLELLRFGNRVLAYLALMDDTYPSTDEAQSVHVELPYPDAATGLNRWLPLVKWFLALPHVLALVFLTGAAVIAVLFAWLFILFTARYPRGLFDFVAGVFRWHNRVIGYAIVLVTDTYPPFSLR